MPDPRQRIGSDGEDAVADRLREQGWGLLARNARTRLGEIDLIALDRDSLVFIEVKSRRSRGGARARHDAEIALESVGPRKQLQVRRLARAWLAENRVPGHYGEIRFDAVGVAIASDGQAAAIEHIEAAF